MQRQLPITTSFVTSFAGYFRFERVDGAISALDGLRGIAVLLVLLRHATLPFQGQGEPILPILGWDAATIFINGWIGVDLFFVLSGFLIAYHIMRGRERDYGIWRWRPYLIKRTLRIVPAYFFVMVVVIAGLIPGYRIVEEQLGFRIGYHLLFLQDYLPANIVVAFWSLGVEEKFYLLAPILLIALAVLRRSSLRIGLLLFGVLLAIFLRMGTALSYPELSSYPEYFRIFRSPFHLSYDGLLLGVLCATVYRDKNLSAWLSLRNRPQNIFWGGCVVIVGFLSVENLLGNITLFDKLFQTTLISLAFAAILLGVLLGAGDGCHLKSDSLLFLSRISYPLYLIHMPLIPLALAISGNSPSFAAFFTVFAVLSLAAALFVHFAVEKPFLILKGRI